METARNDGNPLGFAGVLLKMQSLSSLPVVARSISFDRLRSVAASVCCMLVVGCATTRPAPEVVTLPGAQIHVDPARSDAFDIYDDETLFARARDLFDGGAYADAALVFEKLITEFPTSSRIHASRFQLAHCYLETKNGAKALEHIDAYLVLLGEDTRFRQARRNALFKRGAALALLERHDEVAALFDEMLGDTDLPLRDEVEALVDSGVGHFMRGDMPTAEYRFLKARRLFQAASPPDKATLRFFVAQAAFYLAEIARQEFSTFKLALPPQVDGKAPENLEALLGEQLEEKCQLLLRAQYMFLRVIREEHIGWASAAGFKVGTMYEELYEELVRLPDPSDLDDGGQAMFRKVLKDKVLILLEKAIRVWQSTADMAIRTGADNEWVEKTRASLARVKSYVLAAANEQSAPTTEPVVVTSSES
jgi:tetratricopeptide (TPR) repeat protein